MILRIGLISPYKDLTDIAIGISQKSCIFRLIRTANPEASGHKTGNIRTLVA